MINPVLGSISVGGSLAFKMVIVNTLIYVSSPLSAHSTVMVCKGCHSWLRLPEVVHLYETFHSCCQSVYK